MAWDGVGLDGVVVAGGVGGAGKRHTIPSRQLSKGGAEGALLLSATDPCLLPPTYYFLPPTYYCLLPTSYSHLILPSCLPADATRCHRLETVVLQFGTKAMAAGQNAGVQSAEDGKFYHHFLRVSLASKVAPMGGVRVVMQGRRIYRNAWGGDVSY